MKIKITWDKEWKKDHPVYTDRLILSAIIENEIYNGVCLISDRRDKDELNYMIKSLLRDLACKVIEENTVVELDFKDIKDF